MNPLRFKSIWNRYRDSFDKYAQTSYSQEGEDRVLARLFEGRKTGFYVDIGAHHPRRFSNTFTFYRRGWNGINVDATPGSMAEFTKERPRDTNLEIAILKEPRRLMFFQFNEPALNTFSEELATHRATIAGYHVISVIELEGMPLHELLSAYLPLGVKDIDFLSIDVEGLDLEVLESNDWNRFRPRVVLVEMLHRSIEPAESDAVYQFLRGHNYRFFAKTVQTVFFMSGEYLMERGLAPSEQEPGSSEST